MHIAGGIPYRGRAIEQRSVFYCAFEGAYAFPDRILAIADHLKLSSLDIPLFFSPDRRTFTKVGGASEIIIAIKEATSDPTGLVVLDTMARSFEGDENNSEDMKFYIKCAEDIVQELQCAVLIIHHCGIDGTRPRGHSALTGACDAQIKIERASNLGAPVIQIKAKVEFMKDGPEDVEEYSVLQPCVIDEIEVCFVEDSPKPVKSDLRSLSGNTSKALTILQKELDATGERRIPLQDWKNSFVRNTPGTREGLRKAFDRALERLQSNGDVTVEGIFVGLRGWNVS